MSPVVAVASSGRIDALFRLVAAMVAIVLFEIESKRYGESRNAPGGDAAIVQR